MALVRVKRRPHEDPIDVLLLACKKQKTEDPVSTVFKFAATVEEKNKDRDFHAHVNNAKETLSSDNKDSFYKKRQVADITDKLRAENKLFSQENRLKVINCFRHAESEGQEQELTIIDVENQPHQVTNEAPKDSHSLEDPLMTLSEQYVYDLYYSHEAEFDEIQMENMLSAHAVDECLMEFAENEPEEEENDDEDDSNEEDNWRNDYPSGESTSDSSVEESDIRIAMLMKNVNLEGEYESDLSSDREDEALIYGDDDDHKGRDYYCHSSSSESD